MKNKKGQGGGVPIWLIVVIVLAVIVMVILIFGLDESFGGFRDTTSNLGGGGGDNTHAVALGCNLACDIEDTRGYCKKERSVVFEKVEGKKNPNNGAYTCYELSRGFLSEDLMDCSIACSSGCSDLEAIECGGVENCRVYWMNTGSFEKRLVDEVGSGKRWESLEDLTSLVSDDERDSNRGLSCVRAVEN